MNQSKTTPTQPQLPEEVKNFRRIKIIGSAEFIGKPPMCSEWRVHVRYKNGGQSSGTGKTLLEAVDRFLDHPDFALTPYLAPRQDAEWAKEAAFEIAGQYMHMTVGEKTPVIAAIILRHAPDQPAQLKDQRGINDLAEAECRSLREQLAAAREEVERLKEGWGRSLVASDAHERTCTRIWEALGVTDRDHVHEKPCDVMLIERFHELADCVGRTYDELHRAIEFADSNDLDMTDEVDCGLNILIQQLAHLRQERDELIKQRNEAAGLYYQAKQCEIPELMRERDELRGLLAEAVGDLRVIRNSAGGQVMVCTEEGHSECVHLANALLTRIRAKLGEGN